jgi:hypothetical protein
LEGWDSWVLKDRKNWKVWIRGYLRIGRIGGLGFVGS